MLDRIQFSTGSATATGQSNSVSDQVLSVYVAYQDSPAGTTDVKYYTRIQ